MLTLILHLMALPLSLLPGWTSVPPSRSPTILTPKLVSDIEGLRQRYGIIGISATVVVGPRLSGGRGTIDETINFGTAKATGEAMTDETIYHIASNTKLFTAIATGMLIENQQTLPDGQTMQWHTKVVDILPDFKLGDEYASRETTLVDLLSMRTGLDGHNLFLERDSYSYLDKLKYLPLGAGFRDKMMYNNINYAIAAQIFPVLLNVTLAEYFQEHILTPLNMSSTFCNATDAKATGGRANGFIRVGVDPRACKTAWEEGARGQLSVMPKDCLGRLEAIEWSYEGDGLSLEGMGGIASTGKDMAKWLRELISPCVIPQVVLNAVQSPVIPLTSYMPFPYKHLSPGHYGMANFVIPYRGFTLHGHGGDTPGFSTFLVRSAEHEVGVMVAINELDLGFTSKQVIMFNILDELLGLPRVDWEEEIMGQAFRDDSTLFPGDASLRSPVLTADQIVKAPFSHQAYGSLNFITLNPQGSKLEQQLIKAFHHNTRFVNLGLNITGPSHPSYFIAPFRGFFSDYLVIMPYDGPVALWAALRALPAAEIGRNSTDSDVFPGDIDKIAHSVERRVVIPEAWFAGRAVLTESGIGFFDGFVGDESTSRFAEESPEVAAEAWFGRGELDLVHL